MNLVVTRDNVSHRQNDLICPLIEWVKGTEVVRDSTIHLDPNYFAEFSSLDNGAFYAFHLRDSHCDALALGKGVDWAFH